jgi:hypothetical protein
MATTGAESLDKLLHNVIHEVFQTETSAVRHCRREAERLAATGPGSAMIAISEHASRVLEALAPVCQREGLPVSVGGSTAGLVLSELRDKVVDRLVQSERSYRGTLMGLHHGIDLMKLVTLTAEASGKVALVDLCAEWLPTRTALVQRAIEELAWFVLHPERATALARPLTISKQQRRAAQL